MTEPSRPDEDGLGAPAAVRNAAATLAVVVLVVFAGWLIASTGP